MSSKEGSLDKLVLNGPIQTLKNPLLFPKKGCPEQTNQTLATLPFECGDPTPILCTLLCVKVSDVARDEISEWSLSQLNTDKCPTKQRYTTKQQ